MGSSNQSVPNSIIIQKKLAHRKKNKSNDSGFSICNTKALQKNQTILNKIYWSCASTPNMFLLFPQYICSKRSFYYFLNKFFTVFPVKSLALWPKYSTYLPLNKPRRFYMPSWRLVFSRFIWNKKKLMQERNCVSVPIPWL